MKKILSIFAIYGILSNVNAQGWSESFNVDAKIIGRVENYEDKKLTIKSEFGEFIY